MRFSDDFLAELRARNDIEEIIGKYAEIRHRGSHTPVCLCPFHTEKTPSFVIYRDSQSYYCFGCGAGGDVITFIRNIERLDYTEAVRFLSDRAGMRMPSDPVDDEYTRLRRRCYEANREAAKFFYAALSASDAEAARAYIQKRNLFPETVKHFGLGFAPNTWDSLVKYLKGKGFTEQELIVYNLARTTKSGRAIDAFRNRLMFPIIDLRGNVMAFGGRVLDDSKPKYLNTSDTPVYKKSQGIYALNFAKNTKDRKLILCEGYMDVIAMHQAGFTNAVAGLGTAFTNEQISLLSRYCDELILSFDSDEAGVKATNRALRMLENAPLKVRVMKIEGGKDPDEIIKTQGRGKMENIVRQAVNNTEFALGQAEKKYDLSTPDGKLGFTNEASAILASLRNAVERDLYITKISNQLEISRDAMMTLVKKTAAKQNRHREDDSFERDARIAAGMEKSVSHNPEKQGKRLACSAEEHILAVLLRHPDLLKLKDVKISPDIFITKINTEIFLLIKKRIDENRMPDISSFTEECTDEQISYIAYLFTVGEKLVKPEGVYRDCINTLIKEKNSLNAPKVEDMTDSDFAAQIRKISEQKNNI